MVNLIFELILIGFIVFFGHRAHKLSNALWHISGHSPHMDEKPIDTVWYLQTLANEGLGLKAKVYRPEAGKDGKE